ncbi:MAG: 4-hydroxy-tetrahydrodipicolinate reductase [Eubacteriales bacterium]
MKIIINGAGGRMGQELAAFAQHSYSGTIVVAGVDKQPVPSAAFPCYTGWESVTETADCIVDFSFHTATSALLAYALSHKLPAVIATTGHTPSELAEIKEAARAIPIFQSANMSLGIALLAELAKTAAKTMAGANIEIIERHHNRKEDAPSGTALLLYHAIKEVRPDATAVYGRYGHTQRSDDEIGIHAIRMGNLVGEHEVIVGTDTQTITLSHQAHTRALFAEGAIAAANFLMTQPAGYYTMHDMIRN